MELHVLVDKHRDLFKEELGTISSSQAKLKVRDNAQPKFCKARPVPFAMKERIEEQLVRLESSGIWRKFITVSGRHRLWPYTRRMGQCAYVAIAR